MIISIGEVVWDIFPDRQVLGGAPINVAYHLQAMGVAVRVITRVGRDELGRVTKKQLGELGLALDAVQEGELPTGQVRVTIGADNEPSFDIVAPAAWDAIDAGEALRAAGQSPFHMVFGTLAQRDPRSREAIRALWQKAEQRFYDVNLRPPHTGHELVLDSLKAADMVKVNGDELATIAGWLGITGERRQLAQALMAAHRIRVLVVTEGARGAWLMAGDDYFEHPGVEVTVADTVGAGDAFYATIIEGYINNRPWAECLERANRRGGYVASCQGATPPMPAQI